MKNALPATNPHSPIWRWLVASRSRRTKGRLKRPKRRVAPVFRATLLAATVIGALITYLHSPALLVSTGEFIWSIKSSVVELVLAVVVARVPKHH